MLNGSTKSKLDARVILKLMQARVHLRHQLRRTPTFQLTWFLPGIVESNNPRLIVSNDGVAVAMRVPGSPMVSTTIEQCDKLSGHTREESCSPM